MSTSTSVSLSPPPPPSPGRSSSSTTATTPSTVTPSTRHRSRASFAIAYSLPPPPSITYSSISAAVSLPSTSHPPVTSKLSIKTASSHTHFVVPAHPQSHHLHTIPPREKSTRTLILDHTAWLHGRTRLAQGRCELGMEVRFKNQDQTPTSADAGGRAGFYIASGSGRASTFGDPPEVELASSDEDGECDEQDVRPLGYGVSKTNEHRGKDNGATPFRTASKDAGMEVDAGVEAGNVRDAEADTLTRPTHQSYDPSVVLSLAARASGMQKVLHAMLSQPPSPPPRSPSPTHYALHSAHAHSQHYRPPPTAQSISQAPKPPHALPNGLRLRLALLSLINDLFERQSPPVAEAFSSVTTDASPHIKAANAPAVDSSKSRESATDQSPHGSPPLLPPPSLPPPTTLPASLAALTQVSSQPFYALPTLPSFHTLTLPSSSASGGAGPALSPLSGSSAGPNMNSPGILSSNLGGALATSSKGSTDGTASPTQTRRPPPPLFTWTRPGEGSMSPSSPLPTSPFGSAPYDKDGDRHSTSSPGSPSIARAPPLTAPPRSLPSSWKGSTPKYHHPAVRTSGSGPSLAKRAVGRTRELYSLGCHANPTATSGYPQTGSYRSNVTTYGGTGAATGTPGYPLKKLKTLCPRHLAEKCGICASGAAVRGGPSTRIGAGLIKKPERLFACAARGDGGTSSVLADLIPRFLKLSALVAMELGREARGEEVEAMASREEGRSHTVSTTSTAIPSTRSTSHAQPTRAWYALLCGLLTRTVLEGYVARGWKGAEYVEVLMGVGLGIKGIGTRRSSTGFGGSATATTQDTSIAEEEDAGDFEPDEMPGLIEATKVLFSGLLQSSAAGPGGKTPPPFGAEDEYVAVMEERMSEFLTVPPSTPDLATHLTQLSLKYPAEPVERAALRFCEAVARWRGKPELETYKTTAALRASTTTPAPLLPIDALLASSPTTPRRRRRRPPIDTYFRVPPPSPPRKPKRQRSPDAEERSPRPKKEKLEPVDVDLAKASEAMQDVDSDWVGPYGV